MNSAVLFVDDDPNMLAGVVRNLRGRFQVQTALGAEQGLNAVRQRGPYAPFAIVVADMQMPKVNGITFLTKVAEAAPLTVRMMLTGQSDQQTAIDAVNMGNIFRFLTKPCSIELLKMTLEAGLEQFRLVTAEKDLLAKTLGGSVKLLTDVLAMAQPKAFGRAARVRRLAQQIASRRGIEPMWPIEIAAMLSQVGCVTLPENVLDQVYRAKVLTTGEMAMFLGHPKVGAELVANIPRLGVVAEIIAYQEKRYDGAGPPDDGKEGEQIPQGARVLKLALDFDALLASGNDELHAAREIERRKGWYDPDLVRCLTGALNVHLDYEEREVNIEQLADGMILDEHIISCEGDILITRGNEVTSALRHRLPYHFVHGYVQHLERQLGVSIPVTCFHGDIHLAAEEKQWMSQVEELGFYGDFWIVMAGGKYDFTAKWWNPASYQNVVDHFRGRIQFVQCGEEDHFHPPLEGVINLVGKTDARQFIRLMYHAAGVLCPVTYAMHLAAAVETKAGHPPHRACVVVGGGREPPHWEAYPNHQYVSTVGALPCCQHGGCWRSRCQPVGDGDPKDTALCERPVQVSPELRIPQCMEMISAEDVIRRIELYYEGETLTYLDEQRRTD